MTTTTNQLRIQESFDAVTLRRLAEVRGACLSLFLPDQRPGAASGTHQAVLRQLIGEARAASHGGAGEDAVLAAASALLDDEQLQAGGSGFALFCSAGGVECFRAPALAEASFHRGNCFHLLPLLPQAFLLKDLFVLGVSRRHMRLSRYEQGMVTDVAWPAGVPTSLDEAEHGHVAAGTGHASTGVSPSAMPSVQFGASDRPDREGAGHHMTHFFQMVDAGLAPVLAGLPLLLGGVEEELAAYRRAAKYPQILAQELPGSLEHKRTTELAKLVRAIVPEAYFGESAKMLESCRGDRTISDRPAILQAALAGRVRRLFVRAGAVSDNVLNAAVAETLAAAGEVLVVRAAPEDALAVLRY